jgi:hypothetical protein
MAEGGAEEFLPDDDAAVQAFIGRAAAADERFAQLDADFVHVLEDLIDGLIHQRVINVTDLPHDAQKKLQSRKGHRRPGALSDLKLLGEETAAGGALASDFRLFS